MSQVYKKNCMQVVNERCKIWMESNLKGIVVIVLLLYSSPKFTKNSTHSLW